MCLSIPGSQFIPPHPLFYPLDTTRFFPYICESILKDFLKQKDLYIDDKITPIYSIVVFTAEGTDKTDNIISGISTVGTETKVCTSQNLYQIVSQLIPDTDVSSCVNVLKINDILLELPVRKKHS